MNESADESDLLCFKRPVKLAEVSIGAHDRPVLTKDHFAAVQDANDLVSGRPI